MTGERPSFDVIKAVAVDLARRERSIQAELIAMMPLLVFAKLEPDVFSGPFRQDLYKKLIGSTQLLLDRMREARVMISTVEDEEVGGV